MPTPAAPTIQRNQTIDALRGVAALAVVIGHLFAAAYRESGDSLVRSLSAALAIDYLDWGRFGVTLFFLISGFVVPEFLVRGGSKRIFAAQRVLRIYPTFWVSVAFSVSIAYFLQSKLPSATTVFANLTLFPNLLRQEWLSGVYWTLNIEMLFYMLCVVGATCGLLNSYRWVLALTLTLVALTLGPILVNEFLGKRILPVQFTTYYVSFLLCGVLLRICDRSGEQSALRICLACAPFYFVPVAAGMFFSVAGTFVAHSAFASLTGHLLALVIFLAAVAWKAVQIGGAWLRIGESSYSLYLFHWPICALVIHWIGFGSLLSTAIVLVLSTVLSLVAARYLFWLVERPSIAGGAYIKAKLSS